MRLVKNLINMKCIVGSTAVQVYINEEIGVSEANHPVSSIVKDSGNAVVDSIKVRDEQINVSGTLEYSILYFSEECEMLQGLQGEISFDELVRMPGVREEDGASVRVNVDNISVKILNSRKLLVKAEITIYATAETNMKEDVAVDVAEGEEVSVLKKRIDSVSLVADKMETMRVKDDLALPAGKPSIYKIIWKDVRIKNINTKLMDKVLQVSGELALFIMYISDDDTSVQQWYEGVISFGGNIEMPEVTEDMIAYVTGDIQNVSLELNTNDSGETRDILTNVLIKLGVKIYEEQELDILDDIYCHNLKLTPDVKKGMYQKLLVRNSSKWKDGIKFKVDRQRGDIMQICNSEARLRIDNISICENGIMVTGKIRASIIYVTSNDREPICSLGQEVDFSHKIDAPGISKSDEYYVNWRVDQAVANMVGADEVEIKAAVVLDCVAFKVCSENIITDVLEEEMDMELVAMMPTIKGHIVQEGDTLWKLAKDNYTTVERIKEINKLKGDQIKKGDRLLIMKTTR